VRLYSDELGAGGDVTGQPPGTTNTTRTWPYAVEYDETAREAPECFEVVGGVEGASVDVPAAQGGAECACAYSNFGLA